MILNTSITIPGNINTALGNPSGDIGTLCKSASINPCARFKPYKSSLPLTDEAARALRNYGTLTPAFSWPSSSPVPTVPAWANDTPVGQPSSWFRLTDFFGYDTEAKPPVLPIWAEPDFSASSVDFVVLFDNAAGASVQNGIMMRELLAHPEINGIATGSTLYLWVAIINAESVYAKRASQPIMDIVQSSYASYAIISIDPVNDFSGALRQLQGEYTVLYFLATGEQLTSRNPAELAWRLSLASTSGADRRTYNRSVYSWKSGLSVAQTPTLSGSGSSYKVSACPLSFTRNAESARTSLYYRLELMVFGDGDYIGNSSSRKSAVIASGTVPEFGPSETKNVTPVLDLTSTYEITLARKSSSHVIVLAFHVYENSSSADEITTTQTFLKTC